MRIKIDNAATLPVPPQTLKFIEEAIDSLPWEHTKGLARLKLVDSIVADPRLRLSTELPGLYHPRQGTTAAWIEVALSKLQPPTRSPFKRLAARMSQKSNIAAIIFSLVGQHYFLTSRHSIKKGQLETLVREYAEKRFRVWADSRQSWRAKLFKPFRPTLEAWAKTLQRKAVQAQKKSR
ncbi:MAG: hypothetical protein NVSMB56_02680 [Pyrinomonadaceae bacterium]